MLNIDYKMQNNTLEKKKEIKVIPRSKHTSFDKTISIMR